MPAERIQEPACRPLKVYAFDPSRGRDLNNFMTIPVRYERLQPGPVGEYLAVIDYDASNDVYYEAVNLDSPNVLIRGGVDPSEADPCFHQQMVYAVMSETIRRFEFALGRKIKWRRPDRSTERRWGGKLRVFPHAMQEANAYYDPALRALLFGYFPAGGMDVGSTLPGQTVFTCLSHDIIVHETTHALIDGLREKFTAATHADTPAFHEAFADLVALFQHFSFQEAVLDTLARTGGLLHRARLSPDAEPGAQPPSIGAELPRTNPLIELARQFGEAMGLRKALRQALDTPPNSRDLETTFEPHARGSILVAAVFDAFFTIYLKRIADLMRIARAGGWRPDGDLHPDLAKRLASEVGRVADHFATMCIRALDYCPPIDLRYGEFLRALITADGDLVLEDPWGYRGALIEAFRARGIVPEDVTSYAEEALRWNPPERRLRPCAGLVFDLLGTQGPAAAERNARVLHRYATEHATALGLSKRRPVQPFSFHPIHRISPKGHLVFDFVVEFLQQREAPLDPGKPRGATFAFRGGTTVVFDQWGHVRYAIGKRVENEKRLRQEQDFHQRMRAASVSTPYVTTPRPNGLSFRAIHRGY